MKTCILVALFSVALCAQGPVQSPVGGMPPETVVANIDGKDITAGEVRKMMETWPPNLIQQYKTNPSFALEQAYIMRYLTVEGDKLKLADQSPLKEQLELMRSNVIAGAMVNRERDGYQVPDQAINDFYSRNQSRWERAKIKVIAIGFKPAIAAPAGTSPEALRKAAEDAVAAAHSQTQRSEAEAKTLADELVKKLRAGATFGKFVADYSEDPVSKASSGDFGTVTRNGGSFSDDIKRVVFALKAGEISEPVKQATSLYIIRLEDRTVQPLNEVASTIVDELKQKHLDEFMKSMQQRFTPVVKRPDFFGPGGPGPSALQLNPGIK
jgi:peptidyl-prolyl cis-trans isomerase C